MERTSIKFGCSWRKISRKDGGKGVPESAPQIKEVTMMFLGLEWYWWLLIVAVLILSIPFKVKFMKWWSRREQGRKKEQRGKWGDEE